MKIGLIKETKIPEDNRVALTPSQIVSLNQKYPQHKFIVQSSLTRAYSDDDYRKLGIEVKDDLTECDILFGIKEPDISTLIEGKCYFFFGHFAKEQEYNRPLSQALMKKSITFVDYEYLTDDDGNRVCAFGWWAGVVGVYYTLQCYGLKYKAFSLPKPGKDFTLDWMKFYLKNISLPSVKVLITGNGRVSHGAQYILDDIGARRLSEREYLSDLPMEGLSYFIAEPEHLVVHREGKAFDRDEFRQNPERYFSNFIKWGTHADILLSCHFWSNLAPVYLELNDFIAHSLKIKVIGDITCDIQGSIKSTLRSSTHDVPFYDFNPKTLKEEPAFSSNDNISVMAVDTCPNALALDTSAYFGDMLIQNVIIPILDGNLMNDKVIQRGMILDNGKLTRNFLYLQHFVETNQ